MEFVCSNEGSHPFSRGDNNKISKNTKTVISRIIGPISPTLCTIFFGRLDVLTYKGPWNSQKDDLFSLNQCYSIIKTLWTCVYWMELFLRWLMWPDPWASCFWIALGYEPGDGHVIKSYNSQRALLSNVGYSTYHTWCDKGPRIDLSHSKEPPPPTPQPVTYNVPNKENQSIRKET